MTDTIIADFIQHLRRRQASRSNPSERLAAAAGEMSRPRIYELVTVEYRSDPKFPGFTAIEITGPTAADVQLQMDRIYRSVERDGGQANFMGPSRRAGGYGALGGVSE